MAFRLVHARYDRKIQRTYVEVREPDDDAGEMLASVIFSFRTCTSITNRQIRIGTVKSKSYSQPLPSRFGEGLSSSEAGAASGMRLLTLPQTSLSVPPYLYVGEQRQGAFVMNKTAQRIQARARELARSGTFFGWRPLEFELSFERRLFRSARLAQQSDHAGRA